MCAPASLPGSGLFWGLRRGRGKRAFASRLGQEAAERRPGHSDCPRSGPWGKAPPARSPPSRPRCASFRKRRHDRARLGSDSSFPMPAERSRRRSPRYETAGEAPGSGRNAARVGDCPALYSRGFGSADCGSRLPTAARAPALEPESLGSFGGLSSAPAAQRGTRGPLRLGLRSGLGWATPARVTVNFANQAFLQACASSRSAPSLSSSR